MLIPVGVERSIKKIPFATFALIAICLLVFIWQSLATVSPSPSILKALQEAPDGGLEKIIEMFKNRPEQQYGFLGQKGYITLLTHMFLHGGWMHLIGNMLFLYLTGTVLEDAWGKAKFFGLYVFGGFVAALSQFFLAPPGIMKASALVEFGVRPVMIGASGAVAALMGAFLIRFFSTRVRLMFLMGFMRPKFFSAPAYVVLPLWLLGQIFNTITRQSGNVATLAHIFGFLFGAIVALMARQFSTSERLQGDVALGGTGGADIIEHAEQLIYNKSFGQANTLLKEHLKINNHHAKAWEVLALVKKLQNQNNHLELQRAFSAWLNENPTQAARFYNQHLGTQNITPKEAIQLHPHLENMQAIALLLSVLENNLVDPLAVQVATELWKKNQNPECKIAIMAVAQLTPDTDSKKQLLNMIGYAQMH